MGVFDLPIGSDIDPNADKRAPLYVTSGLFGCLMLLAVSMRFISRRLGKIPLKADDWLILAAVPFALVTNLVDIYGALHNGEGRHINHSTLDSMRRFFQATYVFLICYNISIAIAKYSLIYFYRRIFSTEGFKIPLLATALLTTGWLIGCTFATVFSCTPIRGYWDLSNESKCIDERAFYIGQTASNMVLDVILMVIPVFAISRLHMSRVHKVAVIGIFALGIFVTVCSAVRLAELIKIQREEEFDFTYDIVEAACWSVIENNVSIICACLPTLRPILRLVMSGSAHPHSSSRGASNAFPLSSQHNAISGPFSPLGSDRDGSRSHPLDWEDSGYQAHVYVGNSRPDSQGAASAITDTYGMDTRLRGGAEDIKINTQITWYESRRPSTQETQSTEALPKLKDVEGGH